ncbi:PSP1 domain-containing protein [Lihuaxuella thermophila]|uniref:Cell fate regulator YaaT, PSP1 superfamily (Controls sporulation, competence, biofilm development) n=1 Tax=Lihuaxuella thermophila TaxID=1173111 RepID=A0A1H8I9G3_9BACL|nr:stage 0 sporulation family protein [Lihuaxuella thermophila]SEN64676.1 Cell fate regulator YaaT, PSP1 superfamily (controls sporulation, competence, biofilm development) [Lihuaxuella thermophila]
MLKVIGVRFRQAGKIYYFDPVDLEIQRGDHVIVETVRGIEYGKVVLGIRYVNEDEVVLPLKKVIRIATAGDRQQVEENIAAAKEALGICAEKVRDHQLEMKLVDAEYTFDRNKIIFYFTADGRVDFRELVRDLASVFRTRIELRQIGVRDEAKMLGGIGPCGRVLCCSSFLGDFEPVSIKMAKDQNLSLNPAKISGLCGRLMCCLKYENDHYEEAKQLLPDIGEQVLTPNGDGSVVVLNLLEKKVQVKLSETGALVEHSLEDVIVATSPQTSGI